jgi:enterochelin esterase family protein
MKKAHVLISMVILIVGLLSLGVFEKTSNQLMSNNATILKKENQFKKEIVIKEKHYYTVYLKNCEALLAAIEQLTIDVVIDVFNPDNKLIKSIDGSGKIEPINITAMQSGNFKLEVYPFNETAKKGEYNFMVKDVLSLKENTKHIAKKEIPSKILYELWLNSLSNKDAIDQFIEQHKNKHIIESISGNLDESRVTYFYVPSVNTEYMMQSGGPDFMGLRFKQLATTKLFYASHLVPNDALFNYGFNEFKLYDLGSEKEFSYRDMEHVYDNSVIMPNVIENPYAIKNSTVEKGVVKEFTLKSAFLNEDRKITVHIPDNYDSKKAHKLLILFDGEEYGANLKSEAAIPTTVILDNLHAAKSITPTITVLVWHLGKRNKDLISDAFGDFVAKELVSWAKNNYNIGVTSSNVCVGGSSRGGYAASLIAFNHSEIIGNVISQSGSYWITSKGKKNHWMYPEKQGKLMHAYKKSKKLPIQFYMDIGLYDAGASMLGMNRELRSVLELKGYDLEYNEFKGGHSYLNWKQTLSNGIISIFGKGK